jgi:hypothetical protein
MGEDERRCRLGRDAREIDAIPGGDRGGEDAGFGTKGG